MSTQGHDGQWTWIAPNGEKFTGTTDYIDGCRAGWEARSWVARPRCKFASACEQAHPDDITTHRNGDTW